MNTDNKKKLALIGAGTFAEQVLSYISAQGVYDVVGFFDDNKQEGTTFLKLPILGKLCDIVTKYNEGLYDYVFISIGYLWFDVRERIYNELKNRIPFANIISPLSVIQEGSKLGEGILITDGVYVSSTAVIEDDVCITLRSIVNHGCYIKKHTFFSTNVSLAGNVTIGKKCFIGVGCIISDGISICDNVWLSPGTIVIKNIKKAGKFMSPALKISNIG